MRLAVFSTHPTQYHAPLYRALARHPDIEIDVYYCFNDVHKMIDPGFGLKVEWDLPLLEGYTYHFLPNIRHEPVLDFSKTVLRQLQSKSYDAALVHGYTTLTSLLVFSAAWIAKTPVLLLSPTEPYAHRSILKRSAKQILLRPLFHHMDAILADCDHNRRSFQKYGVPSSRIFMMPSAVDNDHFQTLAGTLKNEKLDNKARLGLDPEIPVILFLNKLIHRKKPFDLLKAYELVTRQSTAYLLFVGDGELRDLLESYCRLKNLHRVYFAGFKNQSEVPLYYSIADVFVLPSRDDASPKSLNEAMNFSLPVVVSDGAGTAPELVHHGVNGFVFPRGNISALAVYTSFLIANPGSAERMGERSLQIVSKNSYKEDIEAIALAIQSVMNHKR